MERKKIVQEVCALLKTFSANSRVLGSFGLGLQGIPDDQAARLIGRQAGLHFRAAELVYDSQESFAALERWHGRQLSRERQDYILRG